MQGIAFIDLGASEYERGLTDLLVDALGQLIGEVTGESFEALLERGLAAAVARAAQRFAREYRAQDAALADALANHTRFAVHPTAARPCTVWPFRKALLRAAARSPTLAVDQVIGFSRVIRRLPARGDSVRQAATSCANSGASVARSIIS
jgi:hypothetical protein